MNRLDEEIEAILVNMKWGLVIFIILFYLIFGE
jgi:Fe2+ transport system protein B